MGSMYRLVIVILAIGLANVHAQVTKNFNCQSNGCCDQHEWCKFWASLGECTPNAEWMTPNCQISCNTCQTNARPASVPAPVPAPAPIPAPAPVPAPAPTFQGNNPGRCQQILNSNGNSISLARSEGLIAEREDISFRRTLSVQDIINSNNQFSCAPQQSSIDCTKNSCFNLRYRTMDGTCNNLNGPTLGAAATPYTRLKSAAYDDGFSTPAGSTKGGRPTPRDASKFLLQSTSQQSNTDHNSLVLQFGQFIVHDILKTSPMDGSKCSGCTEISGRCAPISKHADDPQCGGKECCQSFTRSAPVCGTDSGSTTRTQLNVVSSFLDGSVVYGPSIPDAESIRSGAFLKTTTFNGRSHLPFDASRCTGASSCSVSFSAGDDRHAIFVALTAMQVLFLREHNRLVGQLQRLNPGWSSDRLYQEARKILGAELQAIAYKEWLPKLLGDAMATSVGKYVGYDSNTNPSVANEFAHAAMRFGHGLIPEFFSRADGNGRFMDQMPFIDGVLNPKKILFEGGIDPILRGLTTMPLKFPQRFTTSVTEKMFGSSDLAAINVQRGRDVGLPSYNDMREWCGLTRGRTFDDFADLIRQDSIRNNLKTMYTSPDHVDLYVGAVLETPVSGGAMIGPTLACIVGNQFKRIRDGDRFWYQNPSTFTPQQLVQLEKVTMARIMCDNGDAIQTIPADAFANTQASFCSSISSMDLSPWTE